MKTTSNKENLKQDNTELHTNTHKKKTKDSLLAFVFITVKGKFTLLVRFFEIFKSYRASRISVREEVDWHFSGAINILVSPAVWAVLSRT